MATTPFIVLEENLSTSWGTLQRNGPMHACYIIDDYISALWVERYDEPGDFEITIIPTDESVKYVKANNYLLNPESERIMMIEKIELSVTENNEKHLKASGRSMEAVLDRRVVGIQTLFRNNLEDGVRQIIAHCFTNPNYLQEEGISHQKVEYITFTYSRDSKINTITVNTEFDQGTDILTIVQNLCQSKDLGFKAYFDPPNVYDKITFKLFIGTDRSTSQATNPKNPFIIFSKNMDNLTSTTFVSDVSTFKNHVFVKGHYDGDETYWEMDYVENLTAPREDFIEREEYKSASSQSEVYDEDGNKVVMTGPEYRDLLEIEAQDLLKENPHVKTMDAEVNDNHYIYGEDYNIGDIVTVVDAFGDSADLRVQEFIRSYSSDGIRAYPTFKQLSTV